MFPAGILTINTNVMITMKVIGTRDTKGKKSKSFLHLYRGSHKVSRSWQKLPVNHLHVSLKPARFL